MSSTSLTLLFFAGSVVVSLASGCSSPYQQVGGWCIFVNITVPVNGPGDPITWFQAREFCQESQGDLVSFDDETKLQAVSEHINLNFREESEKGWVYWVGAHRTNGQWQWVNNRPVNLLSHIWLPGEPSTSPTRLHGRLVSADRVYGRRYLLSDDGANSNMPAHICERQ